MDKKVFHSLEKIVKKHKKLSKESDSKPEQIDNSPRSDKDEGFLIKPPTIHNGRKDIRNNKEDEDSELKDISKKVDRDRGRSTNKLGESHGKEERDQSSSKASSSSKESLNLESKSSSKGSEESEKEEKPSSSSSDTSGNSNTGSENDDDDKPRTSKETVLEDNYDSKSGRKIELGHGNYIDNFDEMVDAGNYLLIGMKKILDASKYRPTQPVSYSSDTNDLENLLKEKSSNVIPGVKETSKKIKEEGKKNKKEKK